MKLRIRGNSLRLRLLRSEVERFGKVGRVAETIRFSAETMLSYILESDRNAQTISAHFDGNQICIRVPEVIVRNWVESDEVSLKSEQTIDNNWLIGEPENILKILIEKDFVCLDRKDDADNADAFPHPTGRCG